MRAVIQDEYGTHEVLRVDEVDIPKPKKDEVRIRVHAAAVHAGDTLARLHGGAPARVGTIR